MAQYLQDKETGNPESPNFVEWVAQLQYEEMKRREIEKLHNDKFARDYADFLRQQAESQRNKLLYVLPEVQPQTRINPEYFPLFGMDDFNVWGQKMQEWRNRAQSDPDILAGGSAKL